VAILQSLRKRPRLSPLPKRNPLKIAAWESYADFGGALVLGLVVFEPVVIKSWAEASAASAAEVFTLRRFPRGGRTTSLSLPCLP
jgi:hypothetical protein